MGGGFPGIVPRKGAGLHCSLSTKTSTLCHRHQEASLHLLVDAAVRGRSEPASAVSSFRDLLRDEFDWAESWDGRNGNRHGRGGGT
ncbi:hypothetical protein N656DRAFT_785400 [Canariomyces notabilis]|uniref:Uncharacterized protein n=1 Tax=Canariomyces notabilis TaxID=2074819 RepID=A0AAN6T7V3_9PEZI|nr:hypothetical protein N656DRAFT_785400 [Canariomyces arenarius]